GGRRVVCEITRWTSLGPPPSIPPSPGSFSYKYDSFLSKYPRLHALHNTVVNGSRWCVMDVKQLWVLRSMNIEKESDRKKLTIPQLETLIQTRCEIPKVTAIIILLPLPLTIYVLGIAVIFFPRLVLTRHFWSRQQREEFFLSDVKKGLEGGASLSQSNLPSSIEELDSNQRRELCKLYGGLGIIPWSSIGLKHRYLLTKTLDEQMDVSSLNRDQLIFHLFIRRCIYSIDDNDESLRKKLSDVIQERSSSSPVQYLTSPLRSV
ncbi:hypothetical protein PFISCL1PPCAC_19745, partial [Pristionchus fissidentatus]